ESSESDLSGKRDKYADTPARREALERLRANIGDLPNWDYFTSPNYLFTFSWEVDKPAKKRDSVKFAKEMEARLEEIREKFTELYPPEKSTAAIRTGPVTGEGEAPTPDEETAKKEVYSVIRICHDL